MKNNRIEIRFLGDGYNSDVGSFKKGKTATVRRDTAQPLLDAGLAERFTGSTEAPDATTPAPLPETTATPAAPLSGRRKGV